MRLLNFWKRAPKVNDQSDTNRLPIAKKTEKDNKTKIHEPALREFFNEEHFKAVKRAREFVFQNTPEIRRIPREKTSQEL
jgi:hypothetical protein